MTSLNTVTDSRIGNAVLDDLGHRASDLFQSNCVVWVEGISDIIYFHKWIEVWTNGELKSGIHFLCLPFYGTGNLAHMSVLGSQLTQDTGEKVNEDEEEEDEDDESMSYLMSLIHVNRNIIFIADRDCADPDRIEKARVEEVYNEVRSLNGVGWITKGKEMENYIPESIINSAFAGKISRSGTSIRIANEFVDVPKLLSDNRLIKNKTKLARKTLRHWNRAAIESSLDLRDRLDEVVAFIRKCNHMT